MKPINPKYLLFFVVVFGMMLSDLHAQQDTIFRSFTLRQVDDGVLISFTIRGGITCSGVKVERSQDESKYYKVHEFAGVCGSLNTDESYSFTDNDPLINQTAWYRLDLSSLGLYSDTRSVKFIQYDAFGLVVFPNPCRDDCSVFFSNPSSIPHEAIVYNPSGKEILKEDIRGERWQPKMNSAPAGIYFFRILRDGELRHSGKLLIL